VTRAGQRQRRHRASRKPPASDGTWSTDADREVVTFLAAQLRPGFVLRQLVLEPGTERRCEPNEWADALVVVERGTVEVRCRDGGRATFIAGDLLCLEWLEPRILRNVGSEVALLSAVARRPDSRPREVADSMGTDG
jgi:hypothetical protein